MFLLTIYPYLHPFSYFNCINLFYLSSAVNVCTFLKYIFMDNMSNIIPVLPYLGYHPSQSHNFLNFLAYHILIQFLELPHNFLRRSYLHQNSHIKFPQHIRIIRYHRFNKSTIYINFYC